jgi:hypothetical protein
MPLYRATVHRVFRTQFRADAVTASIAYALARPRDPLEDLLACWWIACKFEQTQDAHPFPEDVVAAFGLPNNALLLRSEKRILARCGFHVPYRTKTRALRERLPHEPIYEEWLHTLLETGALRLLPADAWASVLTLCVQRKRVWPTLRVVAHGIRPRKRGRELCPDAVALEYKRCN